MSPVTVEQYLTIEREAEFRSEYLDGKVVAMAGGARNHAMVAIATAAGLHDRLLGTPFCVALSDLRLYCKPANVLTYPDVVVFCEPARFLDGDEDTLVDAVVLIEVLSRSTQNYDRGEKFRHYRELPSFREYLLLAQNEIRAEHHVRQLDGSWLFREITEARRRDPAGLDRVSAPARLSLRPGEVRLSSFFRFIL